MYYIYKKENVLMNKLLKIIPLFMLLVSCGPSAREVTKEEFDEYAVTVEDTSDYSKISASHHFKTVGYEYKHSRNEVVEENTDSVTGFNFEKNDKGWITDEDSKYALQFIQKNTLKDYKNVFDLDEDVGEWHYYLDQPSVHIAYEEDQMDGEIKAHIKQTFSYGWDEFGRLINYEVTAWKIWYLNGAIEGYGNEITMDYLESLTVSYQ